jgi:RNA polymerase sigma factor (TIGR02999 family)
METMTPSGDVTRLLLNLQAGDASVVEQLTPLVYDELRRMARNLFRRERLDHTLQPTALVHEAFVKLVDQTQVSWESRAHFLAIAARAMRQILVDHSRHHRAEKRGKGEAKVPLDEQLVYSDERAPQIVALDDALTSLAEFDARKARIVELRYFGGLTGEEISQATGVSTATVSRELRVAQAWLYKAMGGQEASASGRV